MSLDDLKLVESGAFRSSGAIIRVDELLVYRADSPVINRSPVETYFHRDGGEWRRFGSGSTAFNSVKVISPGSGFILRLDPAAAPVMWTNDPNY